MNKQLPIDAIKPNFMCIGSQKAGTSWLYEMLLQHPNVWLPKIKEIHFFDYKFGEETNTEKWGPGHIKRAMERIKKEANTLEENLYVDNMLGKETFTFEWYYSIFTHPEAANKNIIGEVTPEYCSISEEGVQAIKELLGDGKVIWMIRDPFDRAISQIQMSANRMLANPPQNNSEWEGLLKNVKYINRANYEKYVPLWDKYFGDDIKYIAYGNMKNNPENLLTEIEGFLGIEKIKYSGLKEVVHKTKNVDLPEWLKNKVRGEVSLQYDFLLKRFGKEFLNDIK
ncbi:MULTISPECIES: sulfotransferase [Halomonadaceae]|uniref:sulfotransferase family protein n=1 Tax=Halomonadaceae TaxID=28256 RepID=UPI00248F0965|nr:sulfotransferase [Halomonas sp. Alg239-R46]|tara:strand:+ start:46 stop:894 length:849 start_codon:yes stop_codon:yes gene_type:complete